MSDYLWDKSGEADPEVERLEKLLQPLAYKPLPMLPRRRPRSRAWIVTSVAATLALAAAIALLITKPWKPHELVHHTPPRQEKAPPGQSPQPMLTQQQPDSQKHEAPPQMIALPASVSGNGARIDDKAVAGELRIAAGQWIETGAARVTLTVGTIGSVELGPNTRARIMAAAETGDAKVVDAVELARGALAAKIDAAPRSFFVATKLARVIDLGCAFNVTVDEAGRGRVAVTAGQVALAAPGKPEVVVAAGATCSFDERGVAEPTMPGKAKAKPGRKPHGSKRAITSPSIKSTPNAQTTPQKNAPAKKDASKNAPEKLNHDALKGLERSIQ